MITKLNTKKRVEKSNLSFKLKIKKLEVEFRKKIDNELSVYEAKIFESRQFSKIQKHLSSIRKHPQVPPIMFWKGMELTTDKQKTESFNFFFASVFNQKTEIPTTCSKQNLNLIKVDSTKVTKLLKDLIIHKSTEPAGIGNLLLRNCSSSITKSVTFLYQTIMNKGTYPTYWKVRQINPIFKDLNKSDVTCYRPISLLNCMSKVLERIIFDEIYELVRHKLCENQFGFRKNRSATLQLLLFLDAVYKKFDNEAIKDLSILYLDFAKIIDTVPHIILIQKLYNIGVGGKLIQLISSYLTNCEQYKKINNEVYDLIEVTSGVPQCSLLGPLSSLFSSTTYLDT